MKDNTLLDFKRDRKKRTQALHEEQEALKNIKTLDKFTKDELIQRRNDKAASIDAWARKHGIAKKKYATCPKCNKPYSKELYEKQISNNREGGPSCIPCISGKSRRA